ncbi:prephenate dehydrogenase [candidate division KSB1 bacterium]|nr:prephenate dehydrogenase [candidate division KSB1 bacterium]
MAFDKICILGVGLIGGSLALAFKRKGIGREIIGFDRDDVIRGALDKKIIDTGFALTDLRRGLTGAGLIILAAPIENNLEIIPEIAGVAPETSLISDVGSTKSKMMDLASHFFTSGAEFVGGHPMAGSEKRGYAAADPFLFENCYYILTPLDDVETPARQKFTECLEQIGAKVLYLDAKMHDQIAAAVSHLPQMIAVSLVNLIAQKSQQNPHYLKMAAGGFRDLTRIASSPFSIWKDICASNGENILQLIDDYLDELNALRTDLVQHNLQQKFEFAAKTRLSIPHDTKGFLHPLFDITVVVQDKPGVIARISTLCANSGINIRDIEILKVRLWEGGTMRLAFESEKDRERAILLLEAEGFICHIRE